MFNDLSEIESHKKTVENLLGKGANQNESVFVIPDFQRPYSWKRENIVNLLQDLTESFENEEVEYFLGSIVTYSDNNKKTYNVVDGQQRLTTLFLMFRYFHWHFDEFSFDDRLKEGARTTLLSNIAQILWKQIGRSGEYSPSSQRFITNDLNEVNQNALARILKRGIGDANDKTNFQAAYKTIQDYYESLFSDYSFEKSINYVYKILEKAWFVAIHTATFESALQIFETVNDRGMRLEKHDVYKSRIYKSLSTAEERREFAAFWDSMKEAISKLPKPPFSSSLSIVFEIYSHFLAAEEGYTNTSGSLLTKYFGPSGTRNLVDGYTTNQLHLITDFLRVGIGRETPRFTDNKNLEVLSDDFEALKKLDILTEYGVPRPIYAATIFFLANKDQSSFIERFNQFLDALVSLVLIAIVRGATVGNELKATLRNINVKAANPEHEVSMFQLQTPSIDDISQLTEKKDLRQAGAWRRELTTILRALEYYCYDAEELLPQNVEREHIVPQNWVKGYSLEFAGQKFSKEEASPVLGNIGNIVLLEKTLNIKASDNFFIKKKEKYASSDIQMALELAGFDRDDFDANDITMRRRRIDSQILELLESLNTFEEI